MTCSDMTAASVLERPKVRGCLVQLRRTVRLVRRRVVPLCEGDVAPKLRQQLRILDEKLQVEDAMCRKHLRAIRKAPKDEGKLEGARRFLKRDLVLGYGDYANRIRLLEKLEKAEGLHAEVAGKAQTLSSEVPWSYKLVPPELRQCIVFLEKASKKTALPLVIYQPKGPDVEGLFVAEALRELGDVVDTHGRSRGSRYCQNHPTPPWIVLYDRLSDAVGCARAVVEAVHDSDDGEAVRKRTLQVWVDVLENVVEERGGVTPFQWTV